MGFTMRLGSLKGQRGVASGRVVAQRRGRARASAPQLPPLTDYPGFSAPGVPVDSGPVEAASQVVDSLDKAGVDVSSVPPEFIVVGAAIVAVAGIAAVALQQQSDDGKPGTSKVTRSQLPRKNAVLVFGATGRTGQLIVKALLKSGRTVIAACRSNKAAQKAWKALGVVEGKQDDCDGILFTEANVDITQPKTLKSSTFAGATQVVVAVGPVRNPDGGGFLANMTSERVDAEGVGHIAEAATQQLPKASVVVEPISQTSDFGAWQPKDDVIMGGTSSSKIVPSEGTDVAKWTGNLVVEGGGFCSVASPKEAMDLSDYDGLCLRVRANGETLKVNIKTSDQEDEPVKAYQASFDTPAGDWTTVRLPWHEFVPVNMAKYNPEAGPLNPAKVSSLGLVYSRFDLNNVANPNHTPGEFSIEIEGGVAAYTAPRPALVLVSSAGTERNALIGDNKAARTADIPIVQLNPGGTLNWKYKGEAAVRAAGLPYCVVRPTGLIQDGDDRAEDKEPYTVEFAQGDAISGRLSREDVAVVVTAALQRPSATDVTFEVRRTKRVAVGGPETFDPMAQNREFLKLSKDRLRRKVGLPPLPSFVEPPAPPSEAEVKAVLASPAVQRAQGNREIKSKTKAEKETAEGATAAAMEANKKAAQDWIAKWRAAAPAGESTVGKMTMAKEKDTGASSKKEVGKMTMEQDTEANKKAAQEWIATWRAATADLAVEGSTLQQEEVQAWIRKWRESAPDEAHNVGSNGSGGAASKAEAQEWIAKWRSKSGAKAKVAARV